MPRLRRREQPAAIRAQNQLRRHLKDSAGHFQWRVVRSEWPENGGRIRECEGQSPLTNTTATPDKSPNEPFEHAVRGEQSQIADGEFDPAEMPINQRKHC